MDLFDTYLNKCQSVEFDWSRNNCGHFGAGWVEMAEGDNKLKGVVFPGTQEEVVAFVKTYGSMIEMITKLLGRHHISPSFAVRGDLVYAPISGSGTGGCGGMLGVCNGSTAIFLREGSGVVTLRMRVATHAWRVNQ